MNLKLVEVPIAERVDGETYLCEMKHGYIEGYWDEREKTCTGYYWRGIEFYPYVTYKVVEDNSQ